MARQGKPKHHVLTTSADCEMLDALGEAISDNYVPGETELLLPDAFNWITTARYHGLSNACAIEDWCNSKPYGWYRSSTIVLR